MQWASGSSAAGGRLELLRQPSRPAWLAATRRCPAPADYFWGVRMQSRSVAVLSLSASGSHGSSMAGVEGRRGGGARRRSGRAAPGNGRVAAPRQEQLAEVASSPACLDASKLDGGDHPTPGTRGRSGESRPARPCDKQGRTAPQTPTGGGRYFKYRPPWPLPDVGSSTCGRDRS